MSGAFSFKAEAAYQRLDFFAFLFFFGIIFLTAFLAFLAIDLAAPATRLVTDFFLFDFFAMPISLAFGFL
jgi:hypothetical protein